jgi:hypothetical protein
MDVVVSTGADQGFSNSFEKTGRKSPRTTFFASIGGDEIFSSDVSMTYQFVYSIGCSSSWLL